MVKKVISIGILLILSVVVTYLTQVVQVFTGGSCSVVGGNCGFPMAFSLAGFLDKPKTDYNIFLIDVLFWFIILFIVWGLTKKRNSK